MGVRLKYGQASRNNVKAYYVYEAKRNNLVFMLSDDHIDRLFESDCHYCGAPPANKSYRPANYGEFVYQGIDKIEQDGDYVPFNVVPCCYDCNHAKGQRTYWDFVAWAKRIGEHVGRTSAT